MVFSFAVLGIRGFLFLRLRYILLMRFTVHKWICMLEMEVDLDLQKARIHALPQEGFYISNFITDDEEEFLLQKILSAPRPRWTHLSHRRLQTYPSALTKSNALLESPLPPWLVDPIIHSRFDKLGIFTGAPHGKPNHVLVNEYTPGQGIMPHEDGAAYYPLVATISLGGALVLDLYEKGASEDDGGCEEGRRRPRYRVLQERRSLLVTTGKLYTDFLHGIAETMRDEGLGPESVCNWDLLREKDRYECGWLERETRISLTYRDVIKVAKVGNTFKFLGGP